MNEFKTICILGRQPAIGLAELESLFGAGNIAKFGEHALLSLPAMDIPFKRLGGTLKVTKILAEIASPKWHTIEKHLVQNIPNHLHYLPEGKLTLGLSAYGVDTDVNQINKTGLKLKKVIKAKGKPVRVVPNKDLALNSAQILHNKLTHQGSWDLNIISDGTKTYLTQTIFAQDINAYAERDQARPKRDSVVGMLPPKLAQIIINMANPNPVDGAWVYDPFCGTGVILQEALLMGYDVVGSDIEPKMIEYTKANLAWLKELYPKVGEQMIELGVLDATTSASNEFYDTIASEVFLGPVLKGRADKQAVAGAVKVTNNIVKKFLTILRIKPDTTFCLAVPAWSLNEEFIHLPLLDHLADLGYNRVSFVHAGTSELIYHRPGQVVARELLVLKKL